MLQYILGRVVSLVPLLLIISVLTFSTLYLIPGDVAELILRERFGGHAPTQAAIDALKKELGLDEPFLTRYLKWQLRILKGDFGNSFRTGAPVINEIRSRLPNTVILAFAGITFSILFSIPLGVVSATKRGRFIDNATLIGTALLISIPSFWLGLGLILIFSVYLNLFPVAGSESFAHFILPTITLGLGLGATTTRLTRSSMLDVLTENYIKTARAKGLSETAIQYRHALRNALIPVVTYVGLQFRGLLGGVVFIEIVFGIRGLGSLLVDSIFIRDFPIIQGCILLFTVTTVLVNLGVDISYVYINPQVQLEKRG